MESIEQIPWQIIKTYQDLKVVEEGGETKAITENKESDFKSFVLTANARPLDYQVMQMMLAIKMLMEVCENQQKELNELREQLTFNLCPTSKRTNQDG